METNSTKQRQQFFRDYASGQWVDCPIFVEEEVLKNSKISSTVSDKISHEDAQKWLENLNEDDMGRYKM